MHLITDQSWVVENFLPCPRPALKSWWQHLWKHFLKCLRKAIVSLYLVIDSPNILNPMLLRTNLWPFLLTSLEMPLEKLKPKLPRDCLGESLQGDNCFGLKARLLCSHSKLHIVEIIQTWHSYRQTQMKELYHYQDSRELQDNMELRKDTQRTLQNNILWVSAMCLLYMVHSTLRYFTECILQFTI